MPGFTELTATGTAPVFHRIPFYYPSTNIKGYTIIPAVKIDINIE
jgi:hypothetical protein